MKRPWWHNEHKTLVVDPNYATQHHGTHSIAEIWQTEGHMTPVGDKVGIEEGIERLKSYMKVDAITGVPGFIISPNCRGLGSELGAWANPIIKELRVYSRKESGEPEQKWNDAISAVIYGVVEHFGLSHTGENEYFTMSNLETRMPELARRRLYRPLDRTHRWSRR
jgi:hypothetical protein